MTNIPKLTRQICKMEEPPRYILGIDPGLTDLGLALLDMDSRGCIRSGCYNIITQAMAQGNDELVISRGWAAITQFLGGIRPDQVISETNIHVPSNRALDVLVCGLLGAFRAMGIPMQVVHPATFRVFYKLGTNKGNRGKNKAATIAKVRSWGMYPVDSITDHETDAILFANYFLDNK